MTFLDVATEPHTVKVALVNNMPDSAFLDTENQFRRSGTGTEARARVRAVHDHGDSTLGGVAALIEERYRGLDELWTRPPDALIVTGTEPEQAQLPYEPYWPYLARLLEWAADDVPTTLLSCLASHASVLLFDGIERVARPVKCSGVFEGIVEDPLDPLATGLPEVFPMPHSRINDVPEAALIDAGYRIVVGTGSSGAGWAVAAREQGDGLFVLCQGHPEYGTLSLLREYRRDVRRCLFGRGAVPYPRLPEGYLCHEAVATSRSSSGARSARRGSARAVADASPSTRWRPPSRTRWAAPSATLYANWLRWRAPPSPGRV